MARDRQARLLDLQDQARAAGPEPVAVAARRAWQARLGQYVLTIP